MSKTARIDWTQLIGTIAVVLGLLLVWEELRATRMEMQRQSTVERWAASSEPFFESAELLSASEKVRLVDGPNPTEAVLVERYGHTPAEALVWSRHLGQLWGVVRADWESGDRDTGVKTIRLLLGWPDTRSYAENNPWDDGPFKEFVESELAASR
jgi:hypothetical protein